MSEAKKLDLSPLDPQTQKILETIKGVGLFSDIVGSGEAIEFLATMMDQKRFRAGQNIVREGEPGTEMFVLIEGKASVYKQPPQGDEYKVAIFDGSKRIAFGESALIEADARSATIRADTDCVCLVLRRESFDKFSKEHPEWALPIFRRIAHAVMARLKKTNNDMMLLYNALVSEIRGQ